MTTQPTHAACIHGEHSQIVQRYFDSLVDGDFARVPWSGDVVLRTPLRPESALRGRSAVEDFFRPMAGQLGAIRVVETYLNESGDGLVTEAFVGPLHVLDKFVIRDGQIVEQENIFDPRPVLDAAPTGGLSPDERGLLVEMLCGSRDRLRKALGAASDDAWNRRPARGGWSAAECAEHLVLTEEALLALIRQKILSGPATPSLESQLRGKDGAVVQAMQDRAAKGKTFDFLEPRGQWPNRLSALDAFLARRADTIEYVRGSREALHHHAAPLEGLGPLDAYHWLLLMASHTDRHVAQLQEALA